MCHPELNAENDRCGYALEIAVTSAITTTKAKQSSEKSNDWVFCTVIQASPGKKAKHAGLLDQQLNPSSNHPTPGNRSPPETSHPRKPPETLEFLIEFR